MSHEKLNGNGHRRREIRRRVLAEEDYCAVCGQLVDKSLKYPHPQSPVVDEDVPRSRGGSQYQRSNTHLCHAACNSWKGTMTLAQARAKLAAGGRAPRVERVEASDIW